MDRSAIQSWFKALSRHEKIIVLLVVMHELTVVVRSLSHYYPADCETRWRLVFHLSEMNHAFTAAAWAMMEDESTYPENDLIEILLDQSNYPEIESSCRDVLEHAVRYLNDKKARV